MVGLLPKEVIKKFAKRLVFITFWPGPAQLNSHLLLYNRARRHRNSKFLTGSTSQNKGK